jgi:hypothetical protein
MNALPLSDRNYQAPSKTRMSFLMTGPCAGQPESTKLESNLVTDDFVLAYMYRSRGPNPVPSPCSPLTSFPSHSINEGKLGPSHPRSGRHSCAVCVPRIYLTKRSAHQLGSVALAVVGGVILYGAILAYLLYRYQPRHARPPIVAPPAPAP